MHSNLKSVYIHQLLSAGMRLKNSVEDFEKHGVFRHLVEGNRDGGAITQITGYLDAILEVYQASLSTSTTMCTRLLSLSQMENGLSTVASIG